MSVEPTKRCSKCQRDLPATPEFFVRNSARSHKDGLFTQCKLCRSGLVNEHNRRRRERVIEKAGRDPGHCDVCGIQFVAGLTQTSGNFDHNHATGEFRGWLCGGCNKALGCAGDNPRLLLALAEYLERTGYAVTREITSFTGAEIDAALEVYPTAIGALL